MSCTEGAEALREKICEVLTEKGVDISLMTFNSFTRTNTMSGEILGLQNLQNLSTIKIYKPWESSASIGLCSSDSKTQMPEGS